MCTVRTHISNPHFDIFDELNNAHVGIRRLPVRHEAVPHQQNRRPEEGAEASARDLCSGGAEEAFGEERGGRGPAGGQ